MSDEPLEILPWGRSLADSEKVDRKKAAARRGGFGCLLMAFGFALLFVFGLGWSVGYSTLCQPDAAEQRK